MNKYERKIAKLLAKKAATEARTAYCDEKGLTVATKWDAVTNVGGMLCKATKATTNGVGTIAGTVLSSTGNTILTASKLAKGEAVVVVKEKTKAA